MSKLKLKKIQLGDDATASNNFTILQPDTPDGSLIIGRNQADGSVAEVARFNANGDLVNGGLNFKDFNTKVLQENNGYQKLPGGMILQWGFISIPGNTIVTVTLPVAFTKWRRSPFITRAGGDGNDDTVVTGDINASAPFSLTDFTARHPGASGRGYTWFCLGE